MLKKLFGEINMTWVKVIIFAIITGGYTAAMNLIPVFKDTSFSDIAVNLECWILFAIIIIMNCKKPLEACMKCFVFFLISQPLVYLIESPFLGLGIFQYYPRWFIWTVLTFPGAFIAWHVKKQNILSTLILSVATAILALMGTTYLSGMVSSFPRHIISTIFCIVLAFVLPIILLKEKKQKIIAIIISAIMLLAGVYFNMQVNNNYMETVSYTLEEGYNWTIEIDDEKNFQLEKISENEIMITIKGKEDKETKLHCTSDVGEKKTIIISMKNGKYNIVEENNQDVLYESIQE